jgi:uncharacterized NAD-dependent epimerase/dehydratase family protein
MQIRPPYLIFLGDAKDALAAKTGQGIVDWRGDWALGQLRLDGCGADLGINEMTIADAVAAGAKTFVIGTVSSGGVLPAAWTPIIVEAIENGLDVASGLHTRLRDNPAIAAAAQRTGSALFDVRHADGPFKTATGKPRTGKRLLTVGTDCSVGKKYTALAIHRELVKRGIKADFRATGQTGILIAGAGIAVDAVVSDFISGVAEAISPDNDTSHWDVVEGQGSLFHPAFAGVSLGLLHGTQPDAFVVCHEPTRTTMRNVDTPIASIDEVITSTITLGRLTNENIRCVGVAINTTALDDASAATLLGDLAAQHGVPATDPMRFGVDAFIDLLDPTP